MKSTIISMLIVLVVLAVLPIVFLGEGNLADRFGFGFGSSSGSKVQASLPKNIRAVTTDKRVEVYTWVDQHGVMQFSQTPPSEGGRAEKIVLKPNTNIMDPIKVPEEKTEVAEGPKVFKIGSPYTPGGMKGMIDESKGLQSQIGEKQAAQEKMLQEMFPPSDGKR